MDSIGQLSPSQTTGLLKSLGHEPVRKLGQNFLIDSNIVRKSLELAEVREGDNVVEVGPGLGTLTGALLAAGAKVYAVELDRRLYAHIEASFGKNGNLKVINADAVDFPRAGFDASEPFKVVANLPYAISTPWLDKILSGPLPSMMSLMLQKEAAQRFSAVKNTHEFSPISIFLNSAYDVKESHKVSASCFYPRPKVDSILLALKIKEKPFVFKPKAKEIIRKIFLKRRKQIASILKDLNEDGAKKWLECASLFSPESRPETIALKSWQELNDFIQ